MNRVLVVEDEPDLRDLVTMLLELEGYEVIAVECGEDGLVVSAREDVDAVLLDISLPGISGWEVLSRLPTRSDGRRPGVVVFSAHVGPVEAARAEELGASAYLTKPYDDVDLLRALASAVG